MPGGGTGSPDWGRTGFECEVPAILGLFPAAQWGHKPSRWMEINEQMIIKHYRGLGSPKRCVQVLIPLPTVPVTVPFGEVGSS